MTVHNVPAQYTKQSIVNEIRDAGFKLDRDYDFLYVPSTVRTHSEGTSSYFINFTSPTAMNAFVAAFHERAMRLSRPGDVILVAAASPKDLLRLQGGPPTVHGH